MDKKNATISELTKLTDYSTSNVKAISYDALLRKDKVDNFFYLQKMLKDTLCFVKIRGACIFYDIHLSEYVLKNQLNFGLKKPKGFIKIEDNLTSKQIKEIDSLYNCLKLKEDSYKEIVYGNECPITNFNWK